MRRIFLDTNIVIDLLSMREPFYDAAAVLFSLSENKVFEIYVSALTFANTHYVLLKKKSSEEALGILKALQEKENIICLDEKIIVMALEQNIFRDFEDALQYYSAEENNIDIIITRDLSDFKDLKLPIMTPKQFINLLK